MTSLDSFSYNQRKVFDIKTFRDAFRFLIVNIFLCVIFLFLIIEEIDWLIFSSSETIEDKVFDNTSWNLNNLFLSLVKM